MITFYPLLPIWLIAVLLTLSVAAMVWALRFRNPLLTVFRQRLLFVCRLLSLAILGLLLLCPGTVNEELNPERSHVAFLIDASGSMGTRDMAAGRSRLMAANDFLASLDLSPIAGYPLHFYGFSDVVERLAAGAREVDVPAAGGTSFKTAFEQLERDVGLGRLAAVVLVSDGIDHSGFSGAEVSTPIFPVPVGSALDEVLDVAIGSVEMPEKVHVGDEVDIRVEVRFSRVPPATPVDLTVAVDGLPVFSQSLVGDRQKVEAAFSHRFADEGLSVVEFTLGRLPGEAAYLNNSRTVAVEVTKANHEILAYFPILTNSFRPLVREFELDDETVFTACLQLSPGRFNLRGKRPNPAFQNGLPETPAPLQRVACLVLSAFNGDLLSPAEALVLEQYVAGGGSLILLGGRHSFGTVYENSPLRDMLPVVTVDDSFADASFQIDVATDERHPFARRMASVVDGMGGGGESALTGINYVGDVKGGANVLLWAKAGQRRPLVVWQPYGRGKVVAVLTNAMHLWGTDGDQRVANYGLFWRQLIAFSRRGDDQADILRLAMDKPTFREGEAIAFTALAVGDGEESPPQILADLFPVAGGQTLETVSATPVGENWQGAFAPVPAGRYVARAVMERGGETLRQRYRFVLVGEDVDEQRDLAVSARHFERYSPASRQFTLEQGADLISGVRQATLKSRIEREYFIIFETPAFLLALVATLFAEWYLRRRFNLF